jgi:hypothetical protein
MIMVVPLYFMNQRWTASAAFLVARRARMIPTQSTSPADCSTGLSLDAAGCLEPHCQPPWPPLFLQSPPPEIAASLRSSQ